MGRHVRCDNKKRNIGFTIIGKKHLVMISQQRLDLRKDVASIALFVKTVLLVLSFRLAGVIPASQSVNNDLRPLNNRHVVPINQDGCVRLDLGDGSRRGKCREILINSLGTPMQVGAPGLLRCRRRVVQDRP